MFDNLRTTLNGSTAAEGPTLLVGSTYYLVLGELALHWGNRDDALT